MRWVALTASSVWGLFVAFLLLGAALDGSIEVGVYALCAFAVWLCAFVLACRRAPSGTSLALLAIPLSVLGPLAVVPVGLSRWRKTRSPRPAERSKPLLEPTQQPPKGPRPLLARAHQPAPVPPRPPIRPAARPRKPKPKHPYQVLAAMLIGCVLAFPVVAVVLLLLVVLGGTHILTITDGRDIAIIAAVAAGAAVVATAIFWHEQSQDLSRAARLIGSSLVVVAAIPGLVGAVYFIRARSPQNLARPSVIGRAEVGRFLTANPGRWSSPGGHLSFDYQWQRCADGRCTDIDGAIPPEILPSAPRSAPEASFLGERIGKPWWDQCLLLRLDQIRRDHRCRSLNDASTLSRHTFGPRTP